ncbi:MAG: hypothetical protein J6E46_04550 [Faecalicoccus sp.]|nr:hypothetical protein [Faecalicoccus sp.]
MNIYKVIKAYINNRKNWENLCNGCGKCCFSHYKDETGHLVPDWHDPCPYLDMDTMRCKVYENRFTVCEYCKKVRLYHALFSEQLDSECGYVKTFRNL